MSCDAMRCDGMGSDGVMLRDDVADYVLYVHVAFVRLQFQYASTSTFRECVHGLVCMRVLRVHVHHAMWI